MRRIVSVFQHRHNRGCTLPTMSPQSCTTTCAQDRRKHAHGLARTHTTETQPYAALPQLIIPSATPPDAMPKQTTRARLAFQGLRPIALGVSCCLAQCTSNRREWSARLARVGSRRCAEKRERRTTALLAGDLDCCPACASCNLQPEQRHTSMKCPQTKYAHNMSGAHGPTRRMPPTMTPRACRKTEDALQSESGTRSIAMPPGFHNRVGRSVRQVTANASKAWHHPRGYSMLC